MKPFIRNQRDSRFGSFNRFLVRCSFILAIGIFSDPHVSGQTFSGSGGMIPDDGTSITFTIETGGLPTVIDTLFGLESVCIHILHTWDADLDVVLIAPDSSYVLLVSGMGGGDDNFTHTCFNSNSETSIIREGAPFTGTFRPIGDLGAVNNGQDGNGSWQLCILDTYAWADQGELLSWSITFGNEPSKPFPFLSSDLPIVIINTNGQFIPDDPKIMVRMGIIDNGPGQRNYVTDDWNGYDGYCGIERRGSSSQMFPKKSYGVELWDQNGNDIDASILGMPSESDWILNAHYSDKTQMRNVMTYFLSNQMGRYATRTRFCEVVLNGQYWGIYALMEKIKRDSHRVDIAKLDDGDTTGLNLTGGYIVKIDRMNNPEDAGWPSTYPPPVHPQDQIILFVHEYPEFLNMMPQQVQYIKTFVDTFETALYNYGPGAPVDYKDYVDLGSFADYFILNELSRNVDGYRLSTFFYKDKGGPLVMGPVWDYDIAWHNADYCEAFNPEGWAYEFGAFCPDDAWQVPFWWSKLLTDTVFTEMLRCRWEQLRTTVLSGENLFSYIDSVADTLNESQQRNFTQWPILGIYVWPNPWPIAETYEGEIDNLKQWISARLDWLDANIPGTCTWTSVPSRTNGIAKVYPNPFQRELLLDLTGIGTIVRQIEIISSYGQVVKQIRSPDGGSVPQSGFRISCDDLPAGIYMILIMTNAGITCTKAVKW